MGFGPGNSPGIASRAAQNVISPVGAEVSSHVTGTFRGEVVRNAFVTSKIAESAKSAPAQGARVDYRTLESRVARQGQAIDYNAVTRIADYHHDHFRDTRIDRGDIMYLIDFARACSSMVKSAGTGMTADPTEGDSAAFLKDNASIVAREKRNQAGKDAGDEFAKTAKDKSSSVKPPRGVSDIQAGYDPTHGDSEQFSKDHASLIASARGRKSSAAAEGTKAEFLFLLQKMAGSDVMYQHALVEMLREYFGEQIAKKKLKEINVEDEEALSFLDGILLEFENEGLSQDIKAGYAVMSCKLPDTMETNPAGVRFAYRELLRSDASYGSMFDALSQFIVQKKTLGEVVDVFMEAIGEDLRSTSPSTDPAFLHGLLVELGRLTKMQTVLEESKKVVADTSRIIEQENRDKLDHVQLTSGLLHFCSRNVTHPADVFGLLGPLSEADPASQLMMANGVKRLHLSIPEDAVVSQEGYREQASVLQFVIDRLVDEEDEAAEAKLADESAAFCSY